jgi:hypothetical protein
MRVVSVENRFLTYRDKIEDQGVHGLVLNVLLSNKGVKMPLVAEVQIVLDKISATDSHNGRFDEIERAISINSMMDSKRDPDVDKEYRDNLRAGKTEAKERTTLLSFFSPAYSTTDNDGTEMDTINKDGYMNL